MIKRRGLGKGLEALLGQSSDANSADDQEERHDISAKLAQHGELRYLPIDLLQRGKYQPRIDMDQERLEELANSIKTQGVVQPIVVRPIAGEAGEQRYEIIAGERRWRASQLAGLHDIPAVVRDLPDQAAMVIAVIENIQREELNPMEEANALQRLIDEVGMTHQVAADAVGRSRAAVSNMLRLLGLTSEVKRLVENGDLEMGHARALLPLAEATQREAAELVISRGLSVRETERLVKRLESEPVKKAATAVDVDSRRLEQEIGEKIGAKVALQAGNKGKGKLIISYNTLDELDGILAHIH
ncbi:MAG: ParB/RepB/Spo0J family partition protein [Gammaproteobacteria bacterium]|nr:ParB/RepB/Spo0J family partition protein [Gammaproteobacteria bacterium]